LPSLGSLFKFEESARLEEKALRLAEDYEAQATFDSEFALLNCRFSAR
jgi:hypothetical protein